MALEELYRTCTADGAAYELDLHYIDATCVQHSRMHMLLTALEELYFNVQCTGQHTSTGGAVHRHWWRSVPALVAQCTGTSGAVYRHWWRSVPALVAQCVKGLLPW